MAENTLVFLRESVDALAKAGAQTWLFGGWAEELRGISLPRRHKDIDLLYPAGDFSLVESFIEERELEEVVAKRFVHKRAFLWNGVLLEALLLQPDPTGYKTNFFGLYEFEWPADTLDYDVELLGKPFPTASVAALRYYRQEHGHIEEAYRRHLVNAKNELSKQ